MTSQRLSGLSLRHATTFANLSEAVLVTDAEGRIVDFNDGFVRYYRFSDRAECGRYLSNYAEHLDVWLADGRPAPRNLWAVPRALKGETASNVEFRLARKDSGDIWWGSYNFAPIRDEAGNIIGAVVAARDITELKEAETRLRESEALLKNVLDGSPLAIFLKDREGRLLLANPVTFAAIGKPAELCIGKTDEEFLANPEDGRAIMANDRRIMDSGQPEVLEETFVNALGRRHYLNSKAPCRDAAGKVIGLIGNARDVTDLRIAEAALRASEERLRTLTETIPCIAWETDADGQNVFMSERWSAVTGLPAAGAAGCGWTKAVHPDDLKRISLEWADAQVAPKPYETRFRMRAAGGGFRWFLVRAIPRFDADGRVVRWVGTSSDIDELVRSQIALAEADRRKDEFLAMLAHELRNPLAPIRSGLDMLRTGAQANAARVHDIMTRQVEHMVRLVDELLEVSRIKQGLITLRRERLDLAGIIDDAVAASQPCIDRLEHRLIVSAPSKPLALDADPTRLAQVLTNLLNNAAKFTPAGGRIEISARREQNDAVVRVRDNGVGIPADKLKAVFELFVRLENGDGASNGGLGIGLALARRLVELHGGELEARSEGPGQGSEFIVRLPSAETGAPTAFEEAKAETTGQSTGQSMRRILVVDDQQDIADLLVMLLETMGADVRAAYAGPAALDIFAEFEPEAVFLDIGMPGMNGCETARRLRQLPGGGPVFLVALTGWGHEEDRRRTREAGFDEHLVKPVSFDTLKAMLAKRFYA